MPINQPINRHRRLRLARTARLAKIGRRVTLVPRKAAMARAVQQMHKAVPAAARAVPVEIDRAATAGPSLAEAIAAVRHTAAIFETAPPKSKSKS